MAERSSNPSHAFAVGERVRTRVGAEWKMGTVVDLQSSEHGSAVTYEVKLDGTARVADGATLYVSDDANEIRVPCEVGSPANPKNARDSLTDLLQECTGTGSNYCVGGEWTAGVLPEITHQETGEFRYPLSAEQATAFITASQRSGVGTMTDTVINLEARKSWEVCCCLAHTHMHTMRTADTSPPSPPPPSSRPPSPSPLCPAPAIDTSTSLSFASGAARRPRAKLLPADLNFVNHDEWEASVLLPMLAHISSSLDLDDWQLGASLYKMLVYEEGCFFRRAPPPPPPHAAHRQTPAHRQMPPTHSPQATRTTCASTTCGARS